MPAMAVKTMTKAAMMYLAVTAVTDGKDEVQDVSAADELIAGDGGVGEEDGDDAEHAGGLVVAGFEQVGDGELREFARARGDEVDEQRPAHPPADCHKAAKPCL